MDDEFLSKQIPRYHCDECTEKVFRCLVSYAAHLEESLYDTKGPSIKQMDEEVNEFDVETKKVITNHVFLPLNAPRSSVSFNMLNHRRGIKNEKSNCWLSSIVHVVCGTGIADLLLSYDRGMSLDVSREISLTRIRLAKDVKSGVTLRMVRDIAKSVDAEFFNPDSNDQKDAAEFYASLITHYFDNVVSDRMIADHKIACIELRHCINCQKTAGSLYRGTLWNIAVPDTDITTNLSDLIWAHMRGGHYEGDPDNGQNVCSANCKTPSLWEVTFIRNFPTVLVINLNRGNWVANNNRINQTPVIIPQDLDVSEYAMRNEQTSFSYQLVALICHHAITNENGHYAAHLVDGNSIVTYDDLEVKKRKAKVFFQLSTVQQSVHMLYYLMKPGKGVENIGRNTHFLTAQERRTTEKYWFGLLQPENRQIDTRDARTVCAENNLNGDIISQFLFAVSSSVACRKVLTTTNNFFDNVQEKRWETAECSYFLMREDIFDLDAIIIPVNVGNAHWVVCSVYPTGKCIVVVDSLRDSTQGKKTFQGVAKFLTTYAKLHGLTFSVNEWVFVAPRHLPTQTDASSCGVFACVNGFNCMLLGHSYMPRPSNILYHRYWITYVACSSPQIQRYDKSKLRNPADIETTRKVDFIIRNNVPGLGKISNFFDGLSKYVDKRKTKFLNVPVNADDSEKETLNAKEQSTPKQGLEQEIDADAHEDLNEINENNLSSSNEAASIALASDSETSSDDEHVDQMYTQNQITKIKELLLQRLVLDVRQGNERYFVLARYGKNELLGLFNEELATIRRSATDYGIDILKQTLYKLFCNPTSDHHYFNISLPTINVNRYGLTSPQFIDYIVLPDAICIDCMKTEGITYEEAVSKTCGSKGSRLTIYWNYILYKDGSVTARRNVGENFQMQAILGELANERANVIVAVVNRKMQAVGKESDNVLKEADVKGNQLDDSSLASCVISCKPGKLKCDKLLLHIGKIETQSSGQSANNLDNLRETIERIFKGIDQSDTCSISMPLLVQGVKENNKLEAITKQVTMVEEAAKVYHSSEFILIFRFVAANEEEYKSFEQVLMST